MLWFSVVACPKCCAARERLMCICCGINVTCYRSFHGLIDAKKGVVCSKVSHSFEGCAGDLAPEECCHHPSHQHTHAEPFCFSVGRCRQ